MAGQAACYRLRNSVCKYDIRTMISTGTTS